MLRTRRGFTLVEIIVVITVIAILTGVGIFGFITYQQQGRNTERQTQTKLIAEALEKYYDENGEYPGCGAMTTPDPQTIVTNTLKNLSTDVFKAPRSPATEKNSIRCEDLTSSTVGDIFAYLGEDSPACLTGAACSEWKLKYREEGSNNIVTIASRRTAQENGTGSTLTAEAKSITRIDLTWPAIAETSSYEIQRSTSAAFSPVTTTSYSGTTVSASITGLAADTTYYFRIRPITSSGTGSWSSAVDVKTLPVVAPTTVTTTAAVYLTTNVRGTITSSCINGASLQYQIRYKSGSSAYSAWEAYTSEKVVAAVVGTSYTFQGQARCTGGGSTSNWTLGTEGTAARPVPAPTGTTSSATMSGSNAVATASGAICSTGTTAEYQIRYNSSPTTTQGAWSGYDAGSSYSVSALQGHKYIFQPQARCVGESAQSAWVSGTTSNVVRPITQTPGAPTLTATLTQRVGDTFQVRYTRGEITSCGTVSTNPDFERTRSIDTADNWTNTSSWNAGNTLDWDQIGQGYSYTASVRGRCVTAHAVGPWGASRSASHITPIDTPAAATGFQHIMSADRKEQRFNYTPPTCGSATRAEHQWNRWIGAENPATGASFAWNSTGAAGWEFPSGWTSPSGYWVNYKINSMINGSVIPKNFQIRIKVRYRCVNPDTGRMSAYGPEALSPIYITYSS